MKKTGKIQYKHVIKRQKSVTLSTIKAQISKSIKETNRKRFAMIEDKERYIFRSIPVHFPAAY